jgi:release factor glutamine methyltransferase
MSARLRDLIREATGVLEKAGIESAVRDARLLVALAAGVPADRVSIMGNEPVDMAAQRVLQDLLIERAGRKPLSQILGRRAFFEHEFVVTPDVLDPRPETEVLVMAALAGPFTRVLDLGTGSGAILISLLAARGAARGVGTDISDKALVVARGNAARIGVAARADLLRSDWFGQIEGRFDLIVSNPPYIALSEMAGLAPELSFEPRMALTDEADGLSAYRAICAGVSEHLTPGGRVMVEIGPTQGAAVAALMADAGLSEITVLPDLDGRDRVVSAVFRP